MQVELIFESTLAFLVCYNDLLCTKRFVKQKKVVVFLAREFTSVSSRGSRKIRLRDYTR